MGLPSTPVDLVVPKFEFGLLARTSVSAAAVKLVVAAEAPSTAAEMVSVSGATHNMGNNAANSLVITFPPSPGATGGHNEGIIMSIAHFNPASGKLLVDKREIRVAGPAVQI